MSVGGVLGGVLTPHTLAAPEAGAGGGVGLSRWSSTCPCLPVRNPLYIQCSLVKWDDLVSGLAVPLNETVPLSKKCVYKWDYPT